MSGSGGVRAQRDSVERAGIPQHRRRASRLPRGITPSASSVRRAGLQACQRGGPEGPPYVPIKSALISEPFRFLLSRRYFSAGGENLTLAIDRQGRRADEFRHHRRRVVDLQLVHQEREPLLKRLADSLAGVRIDAPHLMLERAERLLARLVDELLLRVLRLLFLGGVHAN